MGQPPVTSDEVVCCRLFLETFRRHPKASRVWPHSSNYIDCYIALCTANYHSTSSCYPCSSYSDIPFVLRIIVQSLLPNSPPDLSIEAERLSELVHSAMPPGVSMSYDLNERCPACNAEVPLQDVTSAVCSNGHAWARCSITSFILATPMVRTCIGCSRKAFLPSSIHNQSEVQNWLPTAAQSWVVEELIEAVQCCLFCGNSFVTIL